jgi:CheY-like chemotaxis protein
MPKKILIVDDSRTARMAEKLILKPLDCLVIEAADGEEALAKAQAESPDLILLDIEMPKLGGIETCKRLRELESTKATPIIIVTTKNEPDAMEAGYSSGCNDYVTKPIDGAELTAKILDYIGR